MKKKKNAFTLIELLAIIVILAIVAAIVIPIILNVIENARKGAVKDSAYGYKDSINKYYLGRLSEQPNFNMKDLTYKIESDTGYLRNDENDITYQIAISGQIPTSGNVELEKNAIKKACIKFGDYVVQITNGEVGEAKKGVCQNTTAVSQSNAGDNGNTNEEITAASVILSKKDTNNNEVKTFEHAAIMDGETEIYPSKTDYRYVGATPNNYIYFNCTDYDDQSKSNCEVWRIIGVFDNNLKIISNEILSYEPYDANMPSTEDIDDFDDYYAAADEYEAILASHSSIWEVSTLRTLLNQNYYNGTFSDVSSGSSSSSSSSTGSMYLGKKPTGLINDSTRLIINESTWYLGAFSAGDYGASADDAYYVERSSKTRNKNDKIGLMYPSDYGYTLDCSVPLIESYTIVSDDIWSDHNCSGWLDFQFDSKWTISEYNDNSSYYHTAMEDYSSPGTGLHYKLLYNDNAVFPTVYLKSSVKLVDSNTSNGTIDNPYKIIIPNE